MNRPEILIFVAERSKYPHGVGCPECQACIVRSSRGMDCEEGR